MSETNTQNPVFNENENLVDISQYAIDLAVDNLAYAIETKQKELKKKE
jgi:hypothetical protein